MSCEKCSAEIPPLLSALREARSALIEIARINFGVPNTDERRERTWSTAWKAIDTLDQTGNRTAGEQPNEVAVLGNDGRNDFVEIHGIRFVPQSELESHLAEIPPLKLLLREAVPYLDLCRKGCDRTSAAGALNYEICGDILKRIQAALAQTRGET